MKKTVSASSVKKTGNIMQENHVIKDNSVIDALRLNLDLTKNFISDILQNLQSYQKLSCCIHISFQHDVYI